jgi:hypothetical protein
MNLNDDTIKYKAIHKLRKLLEAPIESWNGHLLLTLNNGVRLVVKKNNQNFITLTLDSEGNPSKPTNCPKIINVLEEMNRLLGES